ncbi:DNA-binding protein RHL1 isoform X6 [Rhodamnia argentea]|uniref:DNA-binding protein RHL1 isoform X6 n=1 Tax=Rhodamnia argentea TaxID=178133 RepID=A0A8B8N199_9MYRT|nr:DNA-binding protein RHL1 isoform X6 [Rhodamnia argentea]
MGRAPKSAGSNPRNDNPEAAERRRLKKLAFSKEILSEAPARCSDPLGPSKTVLKHHGKDIIKKSQRKNRFLFSFPGLVAPIGGGKIGELKDLGTKNPVLYFDFPQGQMKLFGTLVFPENRYLTLQFSKSGKNVMCEDYFDNLIVFSDAWWIGKKEENPEEARLEFPEELIEIPGSLLAQSNIHNRDSVETSEQSEECSVPETKSKKQSATSTTSKETSRASRGSLVQATISTLFKKVEKKNGPEKQEKSRSVTVSGRKSRKTESKRKIDQSQEGRTKKRKVIKGKEIGVQEIQAKYEDFEVEEDPIEESSSDSQDTEGSDAEWAA